MTCQYVRSAFAHESSEQQSATRVEVVRDFVPGAVDRLRSKYGWKTNDDQASRCVFWSGTDWFMAAVPRSQEPKRQARNG